MVLFVSLVRSNSFEQLAQFSHVPCRCPKRHVNPLAVCEKVASDRGMVMVFAEYFVFLQYLQMTSLNMATVIELPNSSPCQDLA